MDSSEQSNGPHPSIVAKVSTDDVPCTEYGVTTNGNTKQSWIAVRNDQIITIECIVRTAKMPYQVDLIVDGILRDVCVNRNSGMDEIPVSFKTGVLKGSRSLWRGKLKTTLLGSGKGKLHYSSNRNSADKLTFSFQVLQNRQPATVRWGSSKYVRRSVTTVLSIHKQYLPAKSLKVGEN